MVVLVPDIVTVLSTPVPDAVTPSPTKLIELAAVDNALPSSFIVIAEPLADDAIVTLSLDAFVVSVILEPATNVKVSVELSATTSL